MKMVTRLRQGSGGQAGTIFFMNHMSMKSEALGKCTLAVEVSNISNHGFWLLLNDKELFLPFALDRPSLQASSAIP
jgi:hypothetical protein